LESVKCDFEEISNKYYFCGDEDILPVFSENLSPLMKKKLEARYPRGGGVASCQLIRERGPSLGKELPRRPTVIIQS
jgi:hypothetical protein